MNAALTSAAGYAESMAGSATAKMAGGLAGAIASARQAKKQRKFIKWQMGNRYQLQVKDLIAAGLNPALAYGNAAPGPAAGGMASIGNPAEGVAQARLASATARKATAEATITEAQVPGAIMKEKVLRDIYEELGDLYNSAKEVAKDPLDALKKYMHEEPTSGKDAKKGVDFGDIPTINMNNEPKSQRLTPQQEKKILRERRKKQHEAWQKRRSQYR